MKGHLRLVFASILQNVQLTFVGPIRTGGPERWPDTTPKGDMRETHGRQEVSVSPFRPELHTLTFQVIALASCTDECVRAEGLCQRASLITRKVLHCAIVCVSCVEVPFIEEGLTFSIHFKRVIFLADVKAT
jgi:hypothetical protein